MNNFSYFFNEIPVYGAASHLRTVSLEPSQQDSSNEWSECIFSCIKINKLSLLPLLTRTIELQWLEHLWDHKNMFEIGVVPVNECSSQCQVRRHDMDLFSIFFNMKVCCEFSL